MERMANSIDELPHWVEPRRDLWPAIAARIEAEGTVSGTPRATRPRAGIPRWIAGLVLASLAVLAIGLYWRIQQAPQADAPLLQAGLLAEAQLGVEEGLAAIRGTRIQIEAALAEDSGNPELQAMLAGSLHEESRVMWLVADAGLPAGVL
jgi:hypothetical protein